MIKIKISNKAETRSVTVRIKDAKDAHDLMVILGNNDYPFTAYGDDGKEE